jgi:hypothetical protein
VRPDPRWEGNHAERHLRPGLETETVITVGLGLRQPPRTAHRGGEDDPAGLQARGRGPTRTGRVDQPKYLGSPWLIGYVGPNEEDQQPQHPEYRCGLAAPPLDPGDQYAQPLTLELFGRGLSADFVRHTSGALRAV